MSEPEIKITEYDAHDLLHMEHPEPKWAIPGIMAEGLNLLCGKPKGGKSALAVNLGIAIANGGLALGKFEVKKGTTLFLALEDTPRRLTKRLQMMLADGGKLENNFKFYTQFPRMHKGGLDALEDRLKQYPDTRLCVIDTLGKFRPPRSKKSDSYDFDYQVISDIKNLADKYEVCILLIHHFRKTESKDRFDDISGTFGLTGAADGILLLIRKTGQADGELKITGRDVDETDFAMKFDRQYLSWNIIGKADEVAKTGKQQMIIDAIKANGFSMKIKEIAETTGLKYEYVQTTCGRLVKQGKIVKTEYGLYDVYE